MMRLVEITDYNFSIPTFQELKHRNPVLKSGTTCSVQTFNRRLSTRPLPGEVHGAGNLRRRPAPPREQRANATASGFSLIELLITAAIILILTTLYFGPNNASKQQALKRVCEKNLEKIYVSMEIYANEHAGRFPFSSGARTSQEALDVLVPKYTSDPSPFVCPGSKDGPLPPGRPLREGRISYAYYMGQNLTNSAQVLMTDRQIDSLPKTAGQLVFSPNGKPPGNNHGKFGGNFLFCDGHTASSGAAAAFSLEITNGQFLLNP